jgi:hypothetical protein
MQAGAQSNAINSVSPLLREDRMQPVLIMDGERELGAIVSMDDYALIRKAKVDRFLRASEELGKQLRAYAFEEGISLEDLEKMLDRKAPKDSR